MTNKSRKAKSNLSENSPAMAEPVPSNQSPSCSSYLPVQPEPAGPPDTLESVPVYTILRNALVRIKALEAKVFELQKAANDTSMREKVAAMEAKVSDIKRADTSTKDKRDLLKSCAVCSKTFPTNASLEKHMHKKHDAPKNFECTVCSKKFFLEWRMKKHTQMHTLTPRNCRYFSNKMRCPFEEIGCMFSHTIPLQPATTCNVDVHGHEEQSQRQQYHAEIYGHEEQPQSQLYHDNHGHADYHAALHGHGVQPQPQLFQAALYGHTEQPQLYHATPM